MDAKIGFDPAENEPPKECCVVARPSSVPWADERAGRHPRIKEIIGTKAYFGGMFCQAHDFCLVHEDVFEDFVRG